MDLVQIFYKVDFPPLVWFFQAVTFLGTEYFFLTLLPILFWCYKKELGLPLTFILYFTFLLNTGLKELFEIPRPDELFHRADADGYGFPSGHAQSAVMLWGYLGYRYKWLNKALAMIFLIGFSRIFLGVHTLDQVVAGWTIGTVTLISFIWVEKIIKNRSLNFPPLGTSLAILLFGMMISIQFPDPTTVKLSGLMVGVSAGFLYEPHLVDFDPITRWSKILIKIILGVGGMLLIRTTLKFLLPDILVADWLRYGLSGVWIGLGAPLVFNKLGN